jgi:hypothetical protein
MHAAVVSSPSIAAAVHAVVDLPFDPLIAIRFIASPTSR